MTVEDFTERTDRRQLAGFGPKALKPFGSIDWCWQTLNVLKIRWEQMVLEQVEFQKLVTELEEARAWEKIPPDNPYGSMEAMLLAEIGVNPVNIAYWK